MFILHNSLLFLVYSSANVVTFSLFWRMFLLINLWTIRKEFLLLYECLFCFISFFFNITLFIYLYFMAVLGLRFCARVFSSCGKWGPLFIAVRGPLTIVASLVAEHRLQTRRLSNCGSRAQVLRGMWDLPRPGIEPMFPALAGGFLTTGPPGKAQTLFSFFNFHYPIHLVTVLT